MAHATPKFPEPRADASDLRVKIIKVLEVWFHPSGPVVSAHIEDLVVDGAVRRGRLGVSTTGYFHP